jgi:amino acid adenylation domain-containing protein/non-ribosomal peptide synthase protein (TIGR01720 family)
MTHSIPEEPLTIAGTPDSQPDEEVYVFPASFSQRRLWFLDQFEPGSPFYNIPTAVRLKGRLDVEALERSLHEIVRRHESLRTTFAMVDGEPMQVIHPSMRIVLERVDLQSLSPDEKETEARRRALEEARRPFDLGQGPLFRATLLELDERDHILLVTMHHIVSDGWSMGVLVREIAVLYEAFSSGKPSPLPDLPIQYADYADWQRQQLQGEALEKHISYWKEQFRDPPPALDLPTDRPRPSVLGSRGASISRLYPKSLHEAVRRMSREEDVTPFMTLMAAFKALLYRYTRQDDLCVGTPIANRTLGETEGLIGFFVNTLAMRTDLSGDPSFRELLQRVREVALGAYAHQDLPFEKLVEELNPDRDMSRTPLFQVMFILQNAPMKVDVQVSDLSLSTLDVDMGTSTFDMTWMLVEQADGLKASVEYNTDLFEAPTIERMLDHFGNLLKAAIADPDQRISALPLLSQLEEQRLVREWNETKQDFPADLCVHQLFEAQVERSPEAVAVVSAGQKITYQELNHRANQLARHLRRRGVGPETLVGISIERSVEMIVGLLGILKAGGAYLPLDPNYPQERLALMMTDSRLSVLLTQEELLSKFPDGAFDVVCIDSDWHQIEQESGDNLDSGVTSENLAYVMYTSGSTGRPKGVLIRHRSVVNHNLSVIELFRLSPDDLVLQFATISFDTSVEEIFPTLMVGATLVLRGTEVVISPAELTRLIEAERLTVLDLPTAYWHQWVSELSQSNEGLPDSLRLVILGGEKASAEKFIAWNRAGGAEIDLVNTYGPTETTIVATSYEPDASEKRRDDLYDLPIGRPIPNAQTYILDTNLRPVPLGVPGELYIGGEGVARGYLNRPDLTADRFLPDPFSRQPGGRLYRTGDLVRYRSDGIIEFLGRTDEQVKIRGFRVEPGDVEAALRQHPALREVAVVARQDSPGEHRLVAYCVPHLTRVPAPSDRRRHVRVPLSAEAVVRASGDGTTVLNTENLSVGGLTLSLQSPDWKENHAVEVSLQLPGSEARLDLSGVISWKRENRIGIRFHDISATQEAVLSEVIDQAIEEQRAFVGELRGFLLAKLPEYMIPSAFVVLEALPMTPNGKLDIRALPAPESTRPESEQEYVAPRTLTEELLASIWAEVLGLDQVGVHDHFFQIGGHSLLATQVIARIRSTFGVELPLRKLFETPTVAGLAASIDVAQTSDNGRQLPPLQQVPRDDELPLSFAQQRLWFLDQLEPNSPFYNIPSAVRLRGRLDVPALERSINEIIRRHEVLRTNFRSVDGRPAQVISPSLELSLTVEDLSGLPESERETEVHRRAVEEARRAFNLANDPLIRVVLLRLAEEEHVVLLTVHHIVSDGWSTGIFIEEIAALYDAFSNGRPSPLPDLPIQYADFASWQRQWLQGEVLEEQLAYWKQQLAGSPPVLELPTDYPRPSVQTFRGAIQEVKFPKDLSEALKKVGRDEGVTLFMTLLAAFQTLLHRYSGQVDINIGTPIANRTQPEVERLIGFFANTLVIRTDLSGNPSFRDLLKRVRKVSLEAYAHQDLPFEKLVDALQPERDLSHSPLFQVMFAFDNAPLRPVQASTLTLEPVLAHSGTSKYDLTLMMVEEPDGLAAALEYCTDLFEPATIERMLNHFRLLLEALANDPDQRISTIPLLADEERHQILVDWNGRPTDELPDTPFHHLFEQQVERTPDLVAVRFNGEELSYQELNARANRLAHHLQKLGVGRDILVGISLPRSVDMMVGLLAVLKAGGAYLPLDPTYPRERLAFMLSDSGVSVLLTNEDVLADLPQNQAEVVRLDVDQHRFADERDDNPDSGVDPDNLAYVIYTSGSTGKPKGTLITHRGLSNYLYWCQKAYPLEAGRGSVVHSTIAFDATVTALFAPLLVGGSVTLLPESADIEALGETLVGEKNFSLIKITPAHLELLSQQLSPAEAAGLTHAFVLGGENLLAEQVAFWRTHAPATRLFNEYGPTETVVGCVVYDIPLDWQGKGSVPIGQPIPNSKIYVLDEYLQPVPVGVPGELYIGGAGVARGYLNRPDLTAEKFIPDPFSGEPGVRLYRTGDRVRFLADGNVEFLGRLDDQVKIRGYRIELGEIEAVLSQHPRLREVVVVARQDGPRDRRLVAYCVPDSEPAPDTKELRDFLKEKLPEYMVPSAFVMLDAIPLTPNGKVDRRALPAPELARSDLTTRFVAPRTEAEGILARIWAEVLHLDQVGVLDNFFELGGDSILSIQVIAKARQAGLHLTPKQIFQYPTVEGLAAVAGTVSTVQAEQGVVTGPVPLTPIQHWFFEMNLAEPHHWNQSVLVEVAQPLDPALLKEAVRHILIHHDALRLRFEQTDSGWRQLEAEVDESVPFEHVDLSGLSAEAQSARIESMSADIQAGLDLEAGPLLKVAYFDLGEDRPHRLLIVIHHLAVDGVSWRILMEDIQTAYSQLRQGQAVQLPAKTTSFQHWAHRLVDYAQSEAVRGQLDHWMTLAKTEVSSLPVDFPEEDNSESSADTLTTRLTEEETDALLHEVPRAYRTQINEVLLTALARAFRRWTGQGSVLVDLEGHGREDLFDDVDLSRTVGWFTSIFPVLLDLGETDEPGEELRRIKEQLRAIPERGIGYGLLRYLCQDDDVRAALSELPRPQVSFNYLGQFSEGAAESGAFSPALESRGPERSPRGARTHVLEINSTVSGGRLQIEWTFGTRLHRRITIERLATFFIEELRSLISHCLSPEAGGYTLSDFPLARLSQAALDDLYATDRDVEDVYPLSPMQQGMLFHSLFAPASGVYVEQLSCPLRGELNIPAFERAWRQVLDRHPALRTSFLWEGLDEPHQVVHRHVELPLEQHDWTSLPRSEQSDRLEELLRSERQQGVDLAKAPLMRLALIRVDQETTHLVWTYHHLLMDGWCLPIVLQEIFTLYEAFCHGQEVQLGPVRPYRDYIDWLQQQDLSEAEAFWRRTLQGFTAPTPLAVDRQPDGETAEAQGYAKEVLRLPETVTASLESTARRSQLTVNTLVQGAWALLLNRYSGEEDVVFGSTVSGRPATLPGAESMVGLFINTLPIRARLDPQARLDAWLKSLQEHLAEVRQYEYTPLVQVQSWSDLPAGVPLFESILVFENYPVQESLHTSAGSLEIPDVRTAEQTNYPITVGVLPGRELSIEIVYDRSRFDRPTVERLLAHYGRLLETFAADLRQPLSSISLLTEAEQRRFLVEWNDTQRGFPDDHCAHELFEAQAEETPDAVALVYVPNRGPSKEAERLTYQELNRRANQLAHYLRRAGVGPEVLVGICVERSVEMVVGLLGILKAGGAYLPIDPSYPEERVAFMLEDAGVSVLLTQETLAPKLEGRGARLVCLDAEWPTIAQERDTNPSRTAMPENLAYAIYTSGSTGKPKASLLEHRGLCNLVNAQIREFDVHPDSRVLQFASFSFDASVSEVFMALARGAALYLVDQDTLLSATRLVEFLREHEITTITLPPSVLSVLPEEDLPALRTLISAGEHCSRDLAARWWTGRRFLNAYGPSEATVCATCYRVEEIPEGSAVPIGRPIDNVQVYLLDRDLNPVPVGVPGELHIGGVSLARGYLGRPELTAEKFIPNPFSESPGSRLYKTGDLARYLPDGNIEFLGRVDHQVKVRGFRIEVGEIEEALRQHPGVQEAVVVAREDATGDGQLVAYFVPLEGASPSARKLRSFLAEKLPDYMVPSAYVKLEKLPLSPNGKVDRKALPSPKESRAASGREYVAPRDTLELKIVRMWEEVLDTEPVGVKDNFFDLGGHSLLAMRLLAQIQQQFGKEIPLVTLFQEPTVESLAAALRDDANQQAWSMFVELQKGGSKPPLYFVHPSGGSVHWYAELARKIGDERPFYGIQAHGLDGDLELHTDIERMASHYVEELIQQQPEGPYLLGGWSLGVIIAYEMAHQLLGLGRDVAFLAILDQGPYIPNELPEDEAEALATMFARYFPLDPDRLREMEPDDRLKYVLRKAKRAKIVPRYVRFKDFRKYILINRTQAQAWRNYTPKPYTGRITLFRSAESVAEYSQEPDMGWGKLAQGGVEIYDVPGDHLSMLQEPNVQVLAEALRACLEKEYV